MRGARNVIMTTEIAAWRVVESHEAYSIMRRKVRPPERNVGRWQWQCSNVIMSAVVVVNASCNATATTAAVDGLTI